MDLSAGACIFKMGALASDAGAADGEFQTRAFKVTVLHTGVRDREQVRAFMKTAETLQ